MKKTTTSGRLRRRPPARDAGGRPAAGGCAGAGRRRRRLVLRRDQQPVYVPGLPSGRRGAAQGPVLRRREGHLRARGHHGREAGDVRVPQVGLQHGQRRALRRADAARLLRGPGVLHHHPEHRLLTVSLN